MAIVRQKNLLGPAVGGPALLAAALPLWSAAPVTRHENFDREPLGWEGVNNRNTNFGPKTVKQDFGYSPDTSHAGGQRGEIGGTINPAAEPAYYGFRLPKPLTFEEPFSASGKLFVATGAGHCLL